jgi:hypothetical protein
MGEIRSHTALDLPELQGDTPYTRLTGDICDISPLCEFSWYEMVWYIDPPDKMDKRKLGKYLGPSHDVGQAMCSRILTANGTKICRTSVIPLSVSVKHSETLKQKIKEFNNKLKEKLGDRIQGIEVPEADAKIEEYEPYEENQEKAPIIQEVDDFDIDAHHKFISSKVMIPQGGQVVTGRVVRRKRDQDGNLIGKSHSDPLLDTSLFEVEFEDGYIETYTANIIAESMYEQVDSEGQLHRMMDEIVYHKKMSDAIHADDARTSDGKARQTTKGWKLCVRWKDGTLSWEQLALLKEGYPIEVAEYAVANKLVSEPAFNWWVTGVLRKWERIISKLNSRYMRREESLEFKNPRRYVKHLKLTKTLIQHFGQTQYKKKCPL